MMTVPTTPAPAVIEAFIRKYELRHSEHDGWTLDNYLLICKCGALLGGASYSGNLWPTPWGSWVKLHQ